MDFNYINETNVKHEHNNTSWIVAVQTVMPSFVLVCDVFKYTYASSVIFWGRFQKLRAKRVKL